MEAQKCITYYLPGVLPRLETKSHTALLTTHFNSTVYYDLTVYYDRSGRRPYPVQLGNRTLLHSSTR